MTVNKRFLNNGFESFGHYKRVHCSLHPNEVSSSAAYVTAGVHSWHKLELQVRTGGGIRNRMYDLLTSEDHSMRLASVQNDSIGGLDVYVFGQTAESVDNFVADAKSRIRRR